MFCPKFSNFFNFSRCFDFFSMKSLWTMGLFHLFILSREATTVILSDKQEHAEKLSKSPLGIELKVSQLTTCVTKRVTQLMWS